MKHFDALVRIILLFFSTLIVLFGLNSSETAAAQGPQPEFLGLPPLELCDSAGQNGTDFVVGFNCRYMVIEGYPRTYIVYVPSTGRPGAPVVFLFHGTNGDGDGYLRKSGWLDVADREGVVLVSASGLRYCPEDVACLDSDPAGWETKWHHYNLYADDYDLTRRAPFFPPNAEWPPDDVGFTARMMDDVSAGLAVDTDRFYASGFSNGAAFSARLAVELSDRLAAVAYSSAGIIDISLDEGPPLAEIPAMALIGTRERGIIEVAGTGPIPLAPEEFLALEELMDFFVIPHLDRFEHHYSEITLEPVEILEGNLHTWYRWRTGQDDHIFQLGVLEGLQHALPNGCDPAKNPQGWVAPDIYWSFFESAPDYPLTEIPTTSCWPTS